MIAAIVLALHVLAAVVWVGGMVFAYVMLRPVAATLLEPPLRLQLWSAVFERFFPWVWAAVVALLGTGLWMIFALFGGFAEARWHVHLMLALGVLMMLLFIHLFFAPYRRLRMAVAAGDWPAGGKALGRIRRIVAVNTVLGVIVVAVAAAGRYL
ncbi:MAG: CopD family protein [Gammaproteobacteria bacterium]|nr:CopD family protein [Gammaproteobacteria bacterium]